MPAKPRSPSAVVFCIVAECFTSAPDSWILQLLFNNTPWHSTVSSYRWCLPMSRAGLEEKEPCVHKGRCYWQHPWPTGWLLGRGQSQRQQRSEFCDRAGTGPTYWEVSRSQQLLAKMWLGQERRLSLHSLRAPWPFDFSQWQSDGEKLDKYIHCVHRGIPGKKAKTYPNDWGLPA